MTPTAAHSLLRAAPANLVAEYRRLRLAAERAAVAFDLADPGTAASEQAEAKWLKLDAARKACARRIRDAANQPKNADAIADLSRQLAQAIGQPHLLRAR